MSQTDGDDSSRRSRPKKLWPWGGKMFHNIVDKDMIKSVKEGIVGNSDKPGLQDRLVRFIKDCKDAVAYDPHEAHPAMSGDLTHEELLCASTSVQNHHKFNVLGCGYMQLEDKYSKGEFLGHGGFAKVYEVTDIKTGETFACKEIAKRKLCKAGIKELLETEIKAMQKLEGADNVLQLHDAFEDPSHLFMILELCRGGDVMSSLSETHVDKGDYSEVAAASLVSMMVSAVSSCHSRGVLHRDIKPENFLWTGENGTGNLKLADFGLAAIQGDGEKIVHMCGTAPYMAPEVWKKEPYATSPDIWALGITMAVLLTGDPPFDADSPSELADVVCNQELDMEQAPWRHLSEGARDLVSRFLEKDPRKRITIKEAMEHPWLNGGAPATSLNSNALSGMQRITEMNQLHRAILTLLAQAALKSSTGESMSIEEKLSKCDTCGSGQVPVAELKAALEGTSYDVSDEETEQILDILNSSGNGTVSYEQFLVGEMHMRAQEAEDTEPLAQAFEMLDHDGDGSVSMQELCQSLEEAGIPCTKELEECFRALDGDGAGHVSLTEFMSFWKQNLQHNGPRKDGSGSPSPGDSALRASVNGSAIFMRKYSYAKSVAEKHATSSAKKRMQA